MPKVTYEFDLPEERNELSLCFNAQNMFSALWDFDQYLRAEIKYKDLPENECDIYEKIRDELWEKMDSFNFNFDMVD